ncbi:alr8563 (plasmid) [Nostoc sp. PCC 7120 = FACHB-418]|nr:alr8563 [Nostoc sp. PCC 7120 = FACHB-418]
MKRQMTKRRARLNDDNDPLSSTDKVLAGFEQISKSASQQDKVSTSREADKSTSQQEKLPTSQQSDKLNSKEANKSASQQDISPTNQQSDKSTSQQDVALTTQEADKSASQQDISPTNQQSDKSTSQQDVALTTQEADKSASQQDISPTSQQSDKSTSQQVNIEKVSLRKSTFQISEDVLHQLDKLHLTLQLELGKAHAPYKEVIVEEALVQLLESFNSDRAALIEVLMSRQKSRDKL